MEHLDLRSDRLESPEPIRNRDTSIVSGTVSNTLLVGIYFSIYLGVYIQKKRLQPGTKYGYLQNGEDAIWSAEM